MGKPTRHRLNITQSGNRLDISFAQYDVWIEVSGFDLPPLEEYSFALLFLLPIAMREGISIECPYPVDPVALGNVRKLAEIWQMWVPEKYRSIEIIATGSASASQNRERNAQLFLYSGGVDSTFMLLQPGVVSQGDKVLTLFGFDYKPNNEAGFHKLIQKTDPLLVRLDLQRIVLKTNLGRITKDFGLTHGFYLAGSAFLFRQDFNYAFLATDFNIAQEMLVFPWGTNHVTNPLFAGSDFKLVSMNQEMSRTQKVAQLSHDLDACHCMTFCGDAHHKPDNCGRCGKCVRTKAMFLLESESLPDIFICNEFDSRHARSIDLYHRSELAFCAEMIKVAKEKNVLERLLEIPQRYEEAVLKLSLQDSGLGTKVMRKFLKIRNKWRRKLIWHGF
jgi:hypothetical protein